MEFFDEAVLEDRIRIDTSRIELVSSPSCVWSVEDADGLVFPLLGYDTQLLGDRTTRYRVNISVIGVRAVYQFGNRHAVPNNRAVHMQDLGLNRMFSRILGDLVVDDAVAQVLSVCFTQGIAVNAVGLEIVVDLVTNLDLVSFAEEDPLVSGRDSIYFEVQGMELFDKSILEDGIGVHTRGVERFTSPLGVRRVEYADSHVLTMLGYDTQLLGDRTTRYRVNISVIGVRAVYQFGNRHAVPNNRAVHMQDLGLNRMFSRILGDLVVDDAVAQVLSVCFAQGIAVNAVGLEVVVNLVADLNLFAFTEEDLFISGRNGVNTEVQSMELFNHIVGDDGICEQSRGEVFLASPCVRRIQYTDRFTLTLLGNDTQLIDVLATGTVDHSLLIGLSDQLGDGHATPIDGLAFVHDDGLSHAVHGVLIDLQIDDTVATSSLRIRTHDRVAQYAVGAAHVVCLTVDADIFAFAEIVLLYFLDLRQDGQLQDIDAVGSCDFADEAVRYLACRSRFRTQVGGAILDRSALPVIRQLALTNGYRVAQDKYRIYLEEQFPHIIATTVGLPFVLVGARLHQIDGGVGSGRRPCIG